jgi:hypothetical protein
MGNETNPSADAQALIREVVVKYLADEAEHLLQEPPERWLSPLRVRVRDAVGQELAATGYDSDYEPTDRGRMLESLVDYLNRLEFGPKRP